MRNGHRLELSHARRWVGVMHSHNDSIKRPKVDARAGFELIDLSVGRRKLCLIAGEHARHRFVQQAPNIDEGDRIRCGKVAEGVGGRRRCFGGGSRPRSRAEAEKQRNQKEC